MVQLYKEVLVREISQHLLPIQIQLLIFIEKFSPLRGFEPATYQVTVYEADDIPMCHRASV